MLLKVFIVCLLISMSQSFFYRRGSQRHRGSSMYPRYKTVTMDPEPERLKYDEQEMTEYIMQQRNVFLQLGKSMNAQAAPICRWNYATLTDPQKRACSCFAIFGFLNDVGYGAQDALSKGITIFTTVWGIFSQPGGPNAACNTRDPNSPRQMQDICLCLTGQALV
ncbi:uncharacterized protein LOC114517804 isoform X2 [Dendronephthya gigantea]|uniref:uncharacterized protein LOC114517804 isoform X2 n=1 Tax=Dendronephthya gigantea TaxID=151771 RepID=UPI00106C80D4|nr:uncharacterized protein LOC114517804 isoform X2 [Dendronephthya gigantea]